MATKVIVECDWCGVSASKDVSIINGFDVLPYVPHDWLRSRLGMIYCSKECQSREEEVITRNRAIEVATYSCRTFKNYDEYISYILGFTDCMRAHRIDGITFDGETESEISLSRKGA